MNDFTNEEIMKIHEPFSISSADLSLMIDMALSEYIEDEDKADEINLSILSFVEEFIKDRDAK